MLVPACFEVDGYTTMDSPCFHFKISSDMHKAEIWPKGSKGSDQIYNNVGNLKHFYVSLQRSVQCIMETSLEYITYCNH